MFFFLLLLFLTVGVRHPHHLCASEELSHCEQIA